MEKICRLCGGPIIVEKMCRIYGEIIDNLWNLYGTLMEILCSSDGKAMEIGWKFCGILMEELCGNYGIFV